MMSFKNRPGFTILETIVSMGIVAGVVTILLMMSSTLLQRTKLVSARVERLFLLRPFLSEAREKTAGQPQEAVYEKDVAALATKLSYRRTRPAENSVLHTTKSVYLERVTATWREGAAVMTESMLTTTYIPAPLQTKERA